MLYFLVILSLPIVASPFVSVVFGSQGLSLDLMSSSPVNFLPQALFGICLVRTLSTSYLAIPQT